MKKVMAIGTFGATLVYGFAGIFGYAAFAYSPNLKTEMEK
jgi:amino acid permease